MVVTNELKEAARVIAPVASSTLSEAEALADRVALDNRNLETIYITHAHFDHFYGLNTIEGGC